MIAHLLNFHQQAFVHHALQLLLSLILRSLHAVVVYRKSLVEVVILVVLPGHRQEDAVLARMSRRKKFPGYFENIFLLLLVTRYLSVS